MYNLHPSLGNIYTDEIGVHITFHEPALIIIKDCHNEEHKMEVEKDAVIRLDFDEKLVSVLFMDILRKTH